MRRGAVFVEEQSARLVVEALAARLGVADRIIAIEHEGKSDLERSVARKVQAWRYPADARFLVARDNNGADCAALKERLFGLVPETYRDRVKVRIVMQELEGWFLGDFAASAAAGFITEQQAATFDRQAKFANPDRLTNAASLFADISKQTGKVGPARMVGPHLDPVRNRSVSFANFVSALLWVAGKPAASAAVRGSSGVALP